MDKINWDKIKKEALKGGVNTIKLNRTYLNASLDEALKLLVREYAFLVAQSGKELVLRDDLKKKFVWLAKYLTGKGLSEQDLNRGLLFMGDVGTGKTTLMNAVLNIIEQRMSKRVRRYETREVISSFLADISFLKSLERRPVFIDDIGKESSVSVYGTQFYVIEDFIALRYNNKAWTFFTTNLNLQQLLERYGLYVVDRLKEMCNILIFNGKSFRG